MAGLVPAIHVSIRGKDVDARHKAGHDGEKASAKDWGEKFARSSQIPVPLAFVYSEYSEVWPQI
jgi:hypothetical protein